MLQPLMHRLSSQRIILASSSPRRKQVLQNVGLNFEVCPSLFEENLDKSKFEHPYEYVLETSEQKALVVAHKLAQDKIPPNLVIGADTVVTMDNHIFEKPADRDDAVRMLLRLSGRTHTVYTGVTLVTPKTTQTGVPSASDESFCVSQFYDGTDVLFAKLTEEIVRAYVDTEEPLDKAGGYGIQAAGGTLVAGIKGDYFNVVGFPLHKFAVHLTKLYQG